MAFSPQGKCLVIKDIGSGHHTQIHLLFNLSKLFKLSASHICKIIRTHKFQNLPQLWAWNWLINIKHPTVCSVVAGNCAVRKSYCSHYYYCCKNLQQPHPWCGVQVGHRLPTLPIASGTPSIPHLRHPHTYHFRLSIISFPSTLHLPKESKAKISVTWQKRNLGPSKKSFLRLLSIE